MPIIFEGRGWKKKPGWFSETWNFLNNIYNLMGNQTEIQNLLTSVLNRVVPKITRLRIYTVKMVVADREYNQVLPANTKSIEVQTTDGTAFRVSTETGRVGPANRPYWSIPTNTSWDRDKLDLQNTTLYFACSTAQKTIEIMIGT